MIKYFIILFQNQKVFVLERDLGIIEVCCFFFKFIKLRFQRGEVIVSRYRQAFVCVRFRSGNFIEFQIVVQRFWYYVELKLERNFIIFFFTELLFLLRDYRFERFILLEVEIKIKVRKVLRGVYRTKESGKYERKIGKRRLEEQSVFLDSSVGLFFIGGLYFLGVRRLGLFWFIVYSQGYCGVWRMREVRYYL